MTFIDFARSRDLLRSSAVTQGYDRRLTRQAVRARGAQFGEDEARRALCDDWAKAGPRISSIEDLARVAFG